MIRLNTRAKGGLISRSSYSYVAIFFGGVLLYLAAVLPFLIYHRGIFFYYGDYNVQQVPFYLLAHRAVRNGNLFWNSHVDLGSSMGGAFAFYLWGSPFFWFSCLFPETWIPYMLPVFESLKYGTAMVTAFHYFKRYTKTGQGALTGALLYAFCGFNATNIVFQHFHDAVCFFPLFLSAFEDLVNDGIALEAGRRMREDGMDPDVFGAGLVIPDRKRYKRSLLFFTLLCALMSVINYFFFYGQVIFFVLYYLVRFVIGTGRRAKDVFRQIGCLIFRGLLGLSIAAFFLVQVIDILTGNTRISEHLYGYDMVAYKEQTTPLAILKSLFLVNDCIGRGTLFTNSEIKNSSLAAFIPCFAIAGVIAYFRVRRGQKDWKKRLLILCAFLAAIPICNSIFAALNEEYYARWYYMPVLFMILITVEELEKADQKELIRGYLFCVLMVVIFTAIFLLPSKNDAGEIEFLALIEHPIMFWCELLGTAVSLAFGALVICKPAWIPKDSDERQYHVFPVKTGKPAGPQGLLTKSSLVCVTAGCLAATMSVLLAGNTIIARTGGFKWQKQMLENVPALPGISNEDLKAAMGYAYTGDDAATLADGQFFRIEGDGTSTNYEMAWGYPTIHCFESTVTPSIVDFYAGIGISRSVDSKMNFSHQGARAILSLRCYLENDIIHQDEEDTYDGKGGLIGYAKAGQDDAAGYTIYENEHFIPMGFTFDSYITEEDYAAIDSSLTRDRLLVKDIVLSDEVAEEVRDLVSEDTNTLSFNTGSDAFLANCDERAATGCTSFVFDNSGFHATTADLSKESLLFLSVPYDDGFTACVDGKETDIVRADWGLMAIRVPAGVHEIRFTYTPAHLSAGIGLSVIAVGVVAGLYFLPSGEVIPQKKRRQKQGK